MAIRINTTKALLSLLIVIVAISLTLASASPSGSSELGWAPVQPACRGGFGKLGECLDLELGIEIDSSESNRRILASSGYIGYDALQRDSTPCSQRGASYYNCRPGAQANPYSRGCSAITRCRG
ncbi:Rapid alkalinization factor [Rhynchospora pubera]|uniref:Rapid alkalinization factor n=1 Tax=Rhynchospora pubera TaxID=906938 RepID=A0AAV8E8K1_9POAL|nr:Rapid alkalinization factor [Rhynchospora pubera]